jgi:hypothetical protein
MANEKYDEDRSRVTAPENPPDSLLRPAARRAALLSYLGPVVILFVVVGIALVYWLNRGPVRTITPLDRSVIGTAGLKTDGGGDPRPSFSGTANEIRNRAGDETSLGSRPDDRAALTTVDTIRNSGTGARRVALSAVQVDSVDGNTIWVREGESRVAIVLPQGTAAPRRGDRVDVSGMTDTQDGSIRVVADAVHIK